MKNIFDRKFIESLVSSDNSNFFESTQEKVISLIALSIDELSQRVPFVSMDNVILQPANETFNGAFTPMSKYVYLLGINSPQMQYNSINYRANLKKFKERFIKAWYDSKRKKSKKRKKYEESQSHRYNEFEPEKYNLDAFRRDLQLAMLTNLSVTTIVYNTSDRLIIQGKDDFGSATQIEIIPCIYDEKTFKYFLNRRKGFIDINMNERLLNFEIKSEICGENLFKILKLFNNLFKNITKENINQIFVESLLYNIPEKFFEGNDIYTIFVNIVNYLNMSDVSKFASIENTSEGIFKNRLTRSSVGLFNKFLRNL